MLLDPFENLSSFIDSINQIPQDICADENLDDPEDMHFVSPHWVDGYITDDGTDVDGYWRDGDGDTSHDLSIEDGGGYWAHDPS
ncbi:hypothetical protein [Clostridium guangxiense]|uniref:hypothetical protein n=1 Tax=Clostridium guangxiense TaxID=1662055 RepID=UPI001E5F42FB|nr:hypothetical protein [Clostridium guangxiense]MCD2347304.1 hypothetical protein [Clostridium guangxiense]